MFAFLLLFFSPLSSPSPPPVRRPIPGPPVVGAQPCRLTRPQELESITDESIYGELQGSDLQMGRWTAEDPSLRAVQRWVRSRR